MQLNGTWYLTVIADALSQVLEPDTRANNTLSPAVAIELTAPYADLKVEVAVGPSEAIEGSSASLSWRVRNDGDSATNAGQWRDVVYLSADGVLDASDPKLASVAHSGALAKGETYTVTFTRKLSGTLAEGKATPFGVAIHSDHASGRFHHVSMGYTMGFGAEGDIKSTKQ